MTKTAIYTRQSQDKGGDAAGVDRQEKACRKMVDAKELGPVTLFSDNDKSASNGKARPEFERLVSAIESGSITAVIVFHLDRLTRTIRDLTRIIEAGKKHRVNIACVHGVSLDLGDPTGVAVATILTAIAAMEVQHKGTRQKAANRQRAEKGITFWTRRPFGYDRAANGVFVLDAEAQAIRDGADRVLAGDTLSAVAKSWNAAGFRTSAISKATGEAGKWGVSQVRRVLMNPRNSGRLIYNGDDLGEGQWPAIISPEKLEQIEQFLNDPRRRTAPDDLNAKHLLSGILKCGKCGSSMFASPMRAKGKEWMVYRCFGSYCLTRHKQRVDEVVQGVILARLALPDAAAALIPGDDLEPLRKEAIELRERRDTLASLLADGLMSAKAVREQSGKLSSQLLDVEGRISQASNSGPLRDLIEAGDIAERWGLTPVSDQRKIVRSLMDVTILPAGKGIRFSPDQVRIDWKTCD
ncbi:recombinase family protein [Arthrobacter sp. E3]|uniref:recombinase family protein n=1 Tax=Arthrobacter sp. E3 TaxID=517402 RepID=UPI001A93A957|nr:recombinase family protein [Arthrobacter sp. E3]